MSTLPAIILGCLAGGTLALLLAAGTLAASARWIAWLVSFAVGALLGAVFLDLLPEALAHGSVERVMTSVLAGVLAFFLLEKFVLWRHAHDAPFDEPGARVPAHHDDADTFVGRPGLMIVIGNSVHNLCDGIAIAASFVADYKLGVATTLAIVSHAIPQQVGDFAVLLHSGYTRRRAFAMNLLTAAATLAGGLIGYLALASMQQMLPTVLALAAASLLYVAVADLIPGLHRHVAPEHTLQQVALIGGGIATVALLGFLLEH
ncbi:MAG TPA: ZIP family metal transporter [Casimicrobiaceae bacterium]|jgi:zinc and cadmium transporter|nr:ZIP family metal transporter [Casimicrobiaceae bacterium]